MTDQAKQGFLLYGANGYTGKLIIQEALRRGLRPELAGRNEAEISKLAAKHKLSFRVFDLEEKRMLEDALHEHPLVVHAAGPFVHTAKPMMEACLRTKTHYLDITGEIGVFEAAFRLDDPAREAGIMIMPGTGFDVVPTDCLAVFLKGLLPGATHLKLAFQSGSGGMSHGTALTMANSLGEGSAERINGKITRVPLGNKTMEVPLGGQKRFVMSIPWGDVSTAFHSTGIPNITTYVGVPPKAYSKVRIMNKLGWLLRTKLVRSLAKAWVDRNVTGPSTQNNSDAKSYIWGEASNVNGRAVQASLTVPGGYILTANTCCMLVEKVLSGKAVPGFQTPGGAYGADFILELDNTERKVLNS